jgi:hypothetical protein
MALLILLVFAAILGLTVRHLDVVQAYINAPVPKAGQYYITVPGIAGVQELLRCLYGMPFSGRSWWEMVDGVLRDKDHMFTPCDSEPCVYTRGSGKDWVCVLLYVDDLLIFGACAKTVEALVASLCKRFKMNDLGTPTRYLGMTIIREDGHITVNQRDYILTLTERYGLATARTVDTPMDTEPTARSTLEGLDGAYWQYADSAECNKKEYQGLVGALLYCSTGTRPDIVRAMSIACSKSSAPTYGDWRMALRILQWLKSSCDLGVRFCVPAKATAADIVLTAYADSSLAPDWQQGDGYSVTGYILYLCGGPILWHSCKQTAIAKSTGEAEFRSLSACVSDVNWVRGLLAELGFAQAAPTVVYEDNQGTLGMLAMEFLSRRTRGIIIEMSYAREALRRGVIRPYFCRSQHQMADGLTKVLGRVLFTQHLLPLLGYEAHPVLLEPCVWPRQL